MELSPPCSSASFTPLVVVFAACKDVAEDGPRLVEPRRSVTVLLVLVPGGCTSCHAFAIRMMLPHEDVIGFFDCRDVRDIRYTKEPVVVGIPVEDAAAPPRGHGYLRYQVRTERRTDFI
jgi:hypothetical protein